MVEPPNLDPVRVTETTARPVTRTARGPESPSWTAPEPQFCSLVDRMMSMDDELAMTMMGDVVRQLDQPPGRGVKAFETMLDDRGRARLRLVFE